MKFKVGDKVRAKVDFLVSDVHTGYIGTVLDENTKFGNMYYVEFSAKSGWIFEGDLELKPDEPSETVITKYVVIYERCDGSIVACETLYDSKEQARQTFEAVYKPEVIVAIKEVSWVKK